MNTLGVNLTNRVVVLKETLYGGTEEERKFLCESGFGLMPFTYGTTITGRRLLNDQVVTIDAEKDVEELWLEPEQRDDLEKETKAKKTEPAPPPVFRDAKADDQLDWPTQHKPAEEPEMLETTELPGGLATTDEVDDTEEVLNSTEPTEPTPKKPKATKDDDSDHGKRKKPRR